MSLECVFGPRGQSSGRLGEGKTVQPPLLALTTWLSAVFVLSVAVVVNCLAAVLLRLPRLGVLLLFFIAMPRRLFLFLSADRI